MSSSSRRSSRRTQALRAHSSSSVPISLEHPFEALERALALGDVASCQRAAAVIVETTPRSPALLARLPHAAVKHKNSGELLQLLVQHPILQPPLLDFNVQDPNSGSSPLHTAAVAGHGRVVAELLKPVYRVRINAQNFDGSTALHIAVQKERTSVAKRLLASGIDPDICDFTGKEAIHYASPKLLQLFPHAPFDSPQRPSSNVNEWLLCRVCFKNSRDTLLLPCTHLSYCLPCAKPLKTCQECGQESLGFLQANIPF